MKLEFDARLGPTGPNGASHRKEYVVYINDAKHTETIRRRLDKVIAALRAKA